MERWAVTLAGAVLLLLAGAPDGVRPDAGDNVRLPRSIWPLRYDLRITTSICEEDPNFSFHGQVSIQFQVAESTNIIKLNVKDLNISFPDTSVTQMSSNKRVVITSQDVDEEHEFFTVQVSKSLCANCTYVLDVKFDGALSTRLTGYYRSKYVDASTGNNKWVAVTQFQATEARRAFPCFDEPEYKATFKISLGRPRKCTALSNMPIIRTHAIPGHPNWVMDEFDVTERMSTYLVAWMISEFRCIKARNGKIRVCAREDGLPQAQLALKVGPMSLQYFEKYFDIKYPLTKLDMVAIPDFNAGAMENWGLVTYRETYLLVDDNHSTLKSKHGVASVVSHELAHQWFGNLVTVKWWSDLWLNEGFATFVAALGVHNAFPHWNSRDVEAVEEFIAVYSLDALSSSHPISANISHPKEISQIFDIISYKKGSLLLRMMSLFLGEEVFRQGVINYLKKYQFGNAEQDDLYIELTAEAHKQRALPKEVSVKEIMDTWTLQTGYPIVTVRREAKSLVFSQKRFLLSRGNRVRHGASDGPCWHIPITYTTPSLRDFTDTKPKAWLKCSDLDLKIQNVAREDEWIIVNIKSAGIYRVNYDTENWRLIGATLNSRHFKSIDVMNRMQIVNDLMHLSWTSDVDIDTTFGVISYLRRETEYLPWRVALQNFDRINKILLRTPGYNSFMRWIRRLLKPSFERLGNPDPDNFHGIRHQEQLLNWACDMQLDACLYQTRVLYAQWMKTQNPSQNDVIPTNLRSISVCMGVKYGGEQEWDFAWNYYMSSNIVTVKVELLKSLGCSSQPWILRRYLSYVLEEHGIRKQDATHVFLSIVKNDAGYEVAKEFIMTRIVDLHKLYGPRNTHVPKWIKGWADMMFTDEEYDEFNEFTEVNKKYLEGAEMTISQAKDAIRDNIQWYKRNYQQFITTLETFKRSKSRSQ